MGIKFWDWFLETTCEWIQTVDTCFETKCGNLFSSEDGDLNIEYDMKFCCFCGKPIQWNEEE